MARKIANRMAAKRARVLLMCYCRILFLNILASSLKCYFGALGESASAPCQRTNTIRPRRCSRKAHRWRGYPVCSPPFCGSPGCDGRPASVHHWFVLFRSLDSTTPLASTTNSTASSRFGGHPHAGFVPHAEHVRRSRFTAGKGTMNQPHK